MISISRTGGAAGGRWSAGLVAGALIVAAAAGTLLAQERTSAKGGAVDESALEGPTLTIYSTADPDSFNPQAFVNGARSGYSPANAPGFGVVRETRVLDLVKGVQELRFTDVAAHIDPTSVALRDLDDPDGAVVLEQAFRFDLVSPTKIYQKYVGKEIGLRVNVGGQQVVRPAKLLSINEGRLVLLTEEGLLFLGPWDQRIHLPTLPEELIARPTLLWKLRAREAGSHRLQTAYLSDGLTWRADYNLVLDEDEARADLSAWVTLMNLSGASYRNARLKLVAGDVQRARRDGRYQMERYAAVQASEAPGGFEEKSFSEYHLYTLSRRTDVMDNSTMQLSLFDPAHGVAVEKRYVLDADAPGAVVQSAAGDDGAQRLKTSVHVRFLNSRENRLGMPLPAGKVRVFKRDEADGALEFIGEDVVDHTPRDERVDVRIGFAFDIVGEKRTLAVKRGERWAEETVQIKVRNRKEEPVEVDVLVRTPQRAEWELLRVVGAEADRRSAALVRFPVAVEPDGEAVVEYTLRTRW